jgi:EAL and modified HD-GYP domain-containing signal transduction protein
MTQRILNEAQSVAPQKSHFFVGRQPILDRAQRIVAYELLFRNGATERADVLDDLIASASVITRCFTELGVQSLLGQHRGFINFNADLLLSDVVEVLPPNQIVIELLETITITPEIAARCRQLKALGYQLALDDVTEYSDSYVQLAGMIDIIKLDLKAIDAQALPETVRKLRKLAPILLAEKVDCREEAEHCKQLGFDLFQGYFYARPVIVSGRRADPSKQILLRLLQQLTTGADTAEIEQTLHKAPELSFKLLRLVNSSASGRMLQISSLQQAIFALGREPLQRWLQILMFAQHGTDSTPSPLMVLAAGRAKLMELISNHLGASREQRNQAFMAGMLSLLDVLFEMPMVDLLDEIRIASDMRETLLTQSGELGLLLRLVMALELGNFAAVAALRPAALSERAMLQLQIEALGWVDSIGCDGA